MQMQQARPGRSIDDSALFESALGEIKTRLDTRQTPVNEIVVIGRGDRDIEFVRQRSEKAFELFNPGRQRRVGFTAGMSRSMLKLEGRRCSP